MTVRKETTPAPTETDLPVFEYTAIDGTIYQLDLPEGTFSPGWLRKYRGKPEMDIAFDLLEATGNDDLIAVVDKSWAEMTAFSKACTDWFQQAFGASMGESAAS